MSKKIEKWIPGRRITDCCECDDQECLIRSSGTTIPSDCPLQDAEDTQKVAKTVIYSCPKCGFSGTTAVLVQETTRDICPDCKGSGTKDKGFGTIEEMAGEYKPDKCPTCNGTGRAKQESELLTDEEIQQAIGSNHSFRWFYRDIAQAQLAKVKAQFSEKLFNETMKAKKSGWDDCEKFMKAQKGEWKDKPDSEGWWWFKDIDFGLTIRFIVVKNRIWLAYVGETLYNGFKVDLMQGKWQKAVLPE